MTDFADSLWTSGADGPWKLTKMDDLGNATFVPNADLLRSGQGSKGHRVREGRGVYDRQRGRDGAAQRTITLGYVDPTVLTSNAPAPGKVGANWSAIVEQLQLDDGVHLGV